MSRSMPGLPVHHKLPEFTQTHAHRVGDAIQSSHTLSSLSPLAWKGMTNLDSILKSRDITLPTKVYLVKAMIFPVVAWMCELDCEECWAPKNWCLRTMVLDKTLESPLDCKEIQPVHPKGDQSWVFIGWTDAEAETPMLWPSHVKSWLVGEESLRSAKMLCGSLHLHVKQHREHYTTWLMVVTSLWDDELLRSRRISNCFITK